MVGFLSVRMENILPVPTGKTQRFSPVTSFGRATTAMVTVALLNRRRRPSRSANTSASTTVTWRPALSTSARHNRALAKRRAQQVELELQGQHRAPPPPGSRRRPGGMVGQVAWTPAWMKPFCWAWRGRMSSPASTQPGPQSSGRMPRSPTETGRGEALLDQLPVARMRLHRDAPQARCGVARANSASTSTPRGRCRRPARRPQATADEGVGHRGVAGFQQQLGLQGDRHVLGELAGAVLDVGGVGEGRLEVADVRGETGVAMAVAQFGEQRVEHPGSFDRARSTSRHCTLPEPSQIEFTGASRYSRGRMVSST